MKKEAALKMLKRSLNYSLFSVGCSLVGVLTNDPNSNMFLFFRLLLALSIAGIVIILLKMDYVKKRPY